MKLRYGCNPHQPFAAVDLPTSAAPLEFLKAEVAAARSETIRVEPIKLASNGFTESSASTTSIAARPSSNAFRASCPEFGLPLSDTPSMTWFNPNAAMLYL